MMSDTLSLLDERARDYPRMTAALDYLSEYWSEQPDLDAVARAAGLSPYHFQRVFKRWTGTTPAQWRAQHCRRVSQA